MNLTCIIIGLEHKKCGTTLCVSIDAKHQQSHPIVYQSKKEIASARIKAVDATHMIANAAVNGVINFLRQARNKIIRVFKKDDPEAAERGEVKAVAGDFGRG